MEASGNLQLWEGRRGHFTRHSGGRRSGHGRHERELRGDLCRDLAREPRCGALWAVLALGGPAEGPILLAGAGADRFCERAGLAPRVAASLCGEGVAPISRSGTVGAVAVTGRAISPLRRRRAGVSASCPGEWGTPRSPERAPGQTIGASRSRRLGKASRSWSPDSLTGSIGVSGKERRSQWRSVTRSRRFAHGAVTGARSYWRVTAASLSCSTPVPWHVAGGARAARQSGPSVLDRTTRRTCAATRA